MRVQGAVIREQGQTFAVVVVKPHVVQNSVAAADAIRGFAPVFGVPVVLMSQDGLSFTRELWAKGWPETSAAPCRKNTSATRG
jgi:hypothetical protein